MRRKAIYEEADEEVLNELPGSLNRKYDPRRLSREDERAEFIDRLRSQVKRDMPKAKKHTKKDAP